MEHSRTISLRERIRLNLVAAMENAGINQVQLAEKLKISKGTVNNWTRGNNSPDVDMVPKICEVLGISVLSLYSPIEFEPLETTCTTKKAPSVSDEARKAAKDYDSLDHHGKRVVRLVLDEELRRMDEQQPLEIAARTGVSLKSSDDLDSILLIGEDSEVP